MLTTLAINNYRSILDLVIPLTQLNVITGANGSGKSNLYRALRLLAETAQGGVVNSLAAEGGLSSSIWAGPETISERMKNGEIPIQGVNRKSAVRLKLGFSSGEFGYSISLGLPPPVPSTAFFLDPEIKREAIWTGTVLRPSGLLVDRNGPLVKARDERSWNVVEQHLQTYHSMFDGVIDPNLIPEVIVMREAIRGWRFYDHFRTDKDAPARKVQLGTRTPVLHHDGRDLAAALQTIIEIGDIDALNTAINDAFPGAQLTVDVHGDGRFSIRLSQQGLLRSLTGAELSDGTLRYILWVAALLTPRPPSLMVLNEPETSLHPDLSQIWVVSHAQALINTLNEHPQCNSIKIEKNFGQTEVAGQGRLDKPLWYWPD
jgi:predicted ATPase